MRWRSSAGGPVRSAPVLSRDAVYVVTESDGVVAFSRASGEQLWDHRREPTDGFHIAGHAGLVLTGDKLLTAFSDGVVSAFDARDGRVL